MLALPHCFPERTLRLDNRDAGLRHQNWAAGRLEGWCVGAKPQAADALAEPINDLEREEDPDGVWRSLVNHWLSEDYARLFDQIDLLVMLKVDSFDAVRRNRALQEEKLRAASPDAPGLMDDDALDRFCAHYERLTRHMLEEMPGRADVVIEIGPDQRPKD